MRLPTRVAALSTLILFSIGLASTPRAFGQMPDATALPESTVFLISADSASEIRDAIGRSQIGQMLADPALEELKGEISDRLDEANTQVEEALGASLTEVLATPQGPTWLAMTLQPDEEIPVGVLLVADAGAKAEQMESIMTGLTKLAVEEGATEQTETFMGMTLHVLTPEEDQPSVVWASNQRIYYIGLGVDAMKELVANASGREDSLATTPAFQAVMDELGSGSALTWYLNSGQLIDLLANVAAEQLGDPGQAEMFMEVLGLNQLRAIGGTVDVATDDYDTIAKTFVYTPGRPTGLLRVFELPAIPTVPEPWVPAEVTNYQTLSWDLDAAFVAIRDLANTFLPDFFDVLEQSMVGPNNETLSIQDDIFGPLGDRITIIADFNAKDVEELTQEDQRSLVGIALDDATTLRSTLSTLFAMAGAKPAERDFRGITIYELAIPELPAGQNAPQMEFPESFNLAVTDQTLFISTEVTLLERVLRGGDSLADDPDFKAVAASYPERASGFSFTRSEQSAQILYNLIVNGGLQDTIDAAGAPGGADVPDLSELIDLSKFPSFSVFSKYLINSGGYSQQLDNGLITTQFSTKGDN